MAAWPSPNCKFARRMHALPDRVLPEIAWNSSSPTPPSTSVLIDPTLASTILLSKLNAICHSSECRAIADGGRFYLGVYHPAAKTLCSLACKADHKTLITSRGH